MIVQACLNGARPAAHHPALPITPEEIARDAAACARAGAAEIHVHPRGPDGAEGLAHVDGAMRAIRARCPGTSIGVSTGAWIEGDAEATRARIGEWRDLPDHASVNLAEPDAPETMTLLERMGVGIEAGLASVADAERLAALPSRARLLRVLVEIEEQDALRGDRIVDGILSVLAAAGIARPILLHGFDATVWHFVERARTELLSTRVGFEDGDTRRDGTRARCNAQLVTDAVAIHRAASE